MGALLTSHMLQRIEMISVTPIALGKIVRMSQFSQARFLPAVALVLASLQRALHGTKNETKQENFSDPY